MERKHFDQSHRLNESKVTLKRRYTENHPAITAGKSARVRNKMLEAIADGKISQEEFDSIIAELSTSSKRWMKHNAKYFNVSEEGISLSKFGKRALNQIKINENKDMKKLVIESFSDFINENQLITEGTRGQFGIIDKKGNIQSVYTHYDSYPDWMLPTIKKHYKNAKKVKEVIAKGDNSGLDAMDKMNFYGDDRPAMTGNVNDIDTYVKLAANDGGAEYAYLYDERDKSWYMVDIYGDRQLVPAFEGNEFDVEETEMISEAFKSSKLRDLVNMDQSGSDAYGKSRNLAAGLYGLSKIKLDQVEDHALVDMDAMDAYKQYANNKDFVVFYIVDNEKENPHADRNSYRQPILKPGILALTRGKDFLGVQYSQRDSRGYQDLRGVKRAYDLGQSDDGVGGNKKYRGYDASGIASVVRAAKLADRAIVFNLVAGGESSRDLVQQRADAQSGALAFKSDKDFKKANVQRYKDILATKASKLPLDKLVEDAINTLTQHIADALKSGEKTQYGEIKIGQDKRGRDIKITDASNIMSSILGDYERYVRYVAEAEREKESGYSSGYYEKNAKEYAKSVSDRVKKVKDMDYAW